MVEHQLRARGIHDGRILSAFARVPRHEFVAPALRDEAYDDKPLIIGEHQTISQPFMHASMLQAAEIQPSDTVLEIGTGSGYQTALLAELAAEVFSIERFPSLAETAQRLLAHLNYANVVIVTGDGSAGWPAAAPYDVIIVSAAAPRPPEPLLEELRVGGRLAIPLGDASDQWLHIFRKLPDGSISDQRLFPVRF